MDRAIDENTQRKNSRTQMLKFIIIPFLFMVAFWALKNFLKTSAEAKEFQIVKVERGDIENTITASGLIVPSFEQQINAPIATEIKEVFLKNGTAVNAGDVILELDEEYIQLEYESLKDQLELRKNNITRLKHEYDKDLKDLDYDDQIMALQLDRMQAQLADARHLQKIGTTTQEEVDQVALNIEIAQLEKKKLENDLAFRKQVIEGDRRNLQLEVLMQEKKLTELRRKLKETSVKAPRAGVVTWINENIGRKVQEGEALVRLANLDRFRIEATCSDRYANRVTIGLPVKVKVNQTILEGNISTILPSIENNTISFNIELDKADATELRPSMRVEVYIISDKKENVLVVNNGPGFTGAALQDIFVVENDKAVKKEIRIGLVNAKTIEITGGTVKEGDRVIISNMEKYQHLDEIQMK